MGWSGLKNGELIARAEAEGFEILIAADQSIQYQQNMSDRRLNLDGPRYEFLAGHPGGVSPYTRSD